MTASMNRRTFLGAAGLAGALALAGCAGGNGATSPTSSASGQASASGSTTQSASAQADALTVGTLATEDLLPLWVAQAKDLFADKNLQVSIVPFQSATELIAGVASGEVDLAMTDIMVTASMVASGVNVQMQWVTLGTTPEQGRFGIMAGPNSQVQKLSDLAGVPIGVGSNTILEYVMDKLLENAGVPDDKIVVEELQKLPVRYQAMASGEVAAAALPGTLLALGEANGCKLIADDTTGDNLSQSVMIVQSSILSDSARAKQVDDLKDVWDFAAETINANPEEFRSVLIENANLPQEIASTYPLSMYPKAELPTASMVDPVLEWMSKKGYLTQPLTYDASTGAFSTK